MPSRDLLYFLATPLSHLYFLDCSAYIALAVAAEEDLQYIWSMTMHATISEDVAWQIACVFLSVHLFLSIHYSISPVGWWLSAAQDDVLFLCDPGRAPSVISHWFNNIKKRWLS